MFNDKDAYVWNWGSIRKIWKKYIKDKMGVFYALLPVKKGKNKKGYTVRSCTTIKKYIMQEKAGWKWK